ncbi:hypothetical protein FA15DRAFT_617005 [Coprinopsis marcescibilis]|uniref:Uncharacterized protein n=1 Tax=Coprinopsis marcescibilis TaxID=230819 RepID=A0A5C3KYW1_COPMA|nr:hypothetical protein FA15DRAFT_617005 [Coprinopsis marcescibilis]
MVVSSIIDIFRWSLQPVAPFTWFGLSLSTLDVVAAFRLCIILRQIREIGLKQHLTSKNTAKTEEQSFVRSVATTYLVVYGGEAVTAPLLGIPPSFLLSGVVPVLYGAVQAIVDYLPAVPEMSAELELPLSVLDGITRAYLLCNLIPPAVTSNASPLIASSPWTLLASTFMMANAGFFFVNFFSFLSPTSLSVQTPPELLPYGWSTADVWCAPATTALYALLTHAQPFWADLHTLLVQMLGGAVQEKGVEPIDPEVARAVCAILLSGLFVGRAAKNFGIWNPPFFADKKVEPKAKTQ